MSELIYRRLPIEEFDRLRPIYASYGEPLPVPQFTVPYVMEDGPEIVGCITGQQVAYVSLFHVNRDYRGTGAAERLAVEGYKLLPEGMQKVFITRNSHVERLAFGMGFIPKVGQLWTETPGGR